MQTALSRLRARARHSDDGGFTLLEVVVAMVVLLVLFTSTAGLLVHMLQTTTRARQQQAANQLADQAMERVRALPYATVIAGSTGDVKSDPAITNDGGVYYFGTEPLDWNSTAPAGQTPLDTYPWPTVEMNGVEFETKTFVTCSHSAFSGAGNQPACTDTSLGPSDQLLYRVTVIVDWKPNGTTETKTVSTQSVIFSPKGCQSTLTHPIAAPCEPFFYGSADSGLGGITIGQASPTDSDPVPGPAVPALAGFTGASLTFPRATASLQSEQTAKVSGDSRASKIGWTINDVDSSLGDTLAAATAGNDAGATVPSEDSKNLSQDATSQTISSADGLTSLALTLGAVTGAGLATTSSVSPSECWDAAPTPQLLATNLSCASSKLVPNVMSAVLTTPSAGSANLVSLSAPSSTDPIELFTGRFNTATGVTPQYCGTAASGAAGCEASAARRAVGDLVVGKLPTGVPPGHMPSNWNNSVGLIKVSGYSDAVQVERGDEATNPGPNASVGAGSMLTYWNGSNYTNVDLSTATAGTVIPVNLSPVLDYSDSVNITMSGAVTIGGTSTGTSGDLADCSTIQCVATATVNSFVIDIVYTVKSLDGATTYANLAVHVDLGKLLASSTYQAAPSGT